MGFGDGTRQAQWKSSLSSKLSTAHLLFDEDVIKFFDNLALVSVIFGKNFKKFCQIKPSDLGKFITEYKTDDEMSSADKALSNFEDEIVRKFVQNMIQSAATACEVDYESLFSVIDKPQQVEAVSIIAVAAGNYAPKNHLEKIANIFNLSLKDFNELGNKIYSKSITNYDLEDKIDKVYKLMNV